VIFFREYILCRGGGMEESKEETYILLNSEKIDERHK